MNTQKAQGSSNQNCSGFHNISSALFVTTVCKLWHDKFLEFADLLLCHPLFSVT